MHLYRKGCDRDHRNKQGLRSSGSPPANAGRLRLCAPLGSAVIMLTSIDLTGDQFVVCNGPGPTCLHGSIRRHELKRLPVSSVYSDADTVWNGTFRRDSLSCCLDLSRPRVSHPEDASTCPRTTVHSALLGERRKRDLCQEFQMR